MITAIDSNILFDVLLPGESHSATSTAALSLAMARGSLVISEAVVAELYPVLGDQGNLADFLMRTGIRLEPSNLQTLGSAGSAWYQYTRSRPTGQLCHSCGTNQVVSCATCTAPIVSRQHILSDFLIGAHASVQADCLLTRDRGYFATYYPALTLIES